MRRWLALLLLCLLPFQVSWAAVADYCSHEHGQAARHFGHHSDEYEAWPGKAGDPAQPGSAGASLAHDHHSHLSGFLGLPGDAALVPAHAWGTSFAAEEPLRPASVPPDQPERPKWSVPA